MAFYGASKLTEIIIPKSVTSVMDIAFEGCSGLKKMYFLGNAPVLFVGTEKAKRTSFTVYYTEGAKGFTSPEWCGYESKTFDAEELYPEYPEELKEPFLSVLKGEKAFRYNSRLLSAISLPCRSPVGGASCLRASIITFKV